MLNNIPMHIHTNATNAQAARLASELTKLQMDDNATQRYIVIDNIKDYLSELEMTLDTMAEKLDALEKKSKKHFWNR